MSKVSFIISLETVIGFVHVRWLSPETYSIDLSCYRLSPTAIGDSRFTFYDGCRYMLKLRIWLTATLKLLTYPYVPPFRFRKEQPSDYPYAGLIWLWNIIAYFVGDWNKYLNLGEFYISHLFYAKCGVQVKEMIFKDVLRDFRDEISFFIAVLLKSSMAFWIKWRKLYNCWFYIDKLDCRT